MERTGLTFIGGIAGIASAVLMVVMMAIRGSDTAVTSTPGALAGVVATVAAGVLFTAALYAAYRKRVPTPTAVAAVASLAGYALFLVAGVMGLEVESPVSLADDILIFIVGVPLFSWVAHTTSSMRKPVVYLGFLTGLAGLAG